MDKQLAKLVKNSSLMKFMLVVGTYSMASINASFDTEEYHDLEV